MISRYQIKITSSFDRRFKKLSKKDLNLKDNIYEVLGKLSINPYQKSLKTHKVNSRMFKNAYSSRVNGDLRVIWRFDNTNNGVINIYDLGGHEGSNKVYN